MTADSETKVAVGMFPDIVIDVLGTIELEL